MSVRNLNWYNLQSTREYPLDDLATSETDEHVAMPSNLLVDAHIRFPETLGKYAYVQGATSAPGIVTILIGVTDNQNTEGVTVAAVRATRPVSPYVNYDITAIVPGVAGWITFGPGIEEMFAGRFSSPKQTLINARCARAYKPLPIPSISKTGLNTTLSGIVKIIGEPPIEAVFHSSLAVAGKTAQAIVLRLNKNDASLSYNPFTYFTGSCGQRPESGTCPKTPIETINGVSPDCHGNIDFVFGGPLTSLPFQNCGGIDILTPTTLAQVCASTDTRRTSFKDLCCPDVVATLSELYAITEFVQGKVVQVQGDPVTYYKAISQTSGTINWEPTTAVDAICGWPDPTDAIPTTTYTLTTMQDYPCLNLPACIDFCSCGDEPPLFETRRGSFKKLNTQAPFGCVPCGTGQEAAPREDQMIKTARNTYVAVNSSSTSIATLKNCATDWAYNKTISAQFKIGSEGLDRNGGIVINYLHDTGSVPPQVKYLAAVLDVSRGELRLLRYVNDSFIAEGYATFPVITGNWYEMAVTPIFTGTGVTIKVVVKELETAARTVELMVPLTFEKYGNPTGLYGLFASRSWTYFNRFTVSE